MIKKKKKIVKRSYGTRIVHQYKAILKVWNEKKRKFKIEVSEFYCKDKNNNNYET